jgi:hypothetical protein
MTRPIAVCVFLLIVSALAALSDAQSPVAVTSAKRTEKYVSHDKIEVAPMSPTEVVLVVELTGISLEEFQATPKTEIFVSAAGRRFEANLTAAGDWQMLDGDRRPVGALQEQRTVVAVVPREILDFSLQFGIRPPVNFKADRDIVALLP